MKLAIGGKVRVILRDIKSGSIDSIHETENMVFPRFLDRMMASMTQSPSRVSGHSGPNPGYDPGYDRNMYQNFVGYYATDNWFGVNPPTIDRPDEKYFSYAPSLIGLGQDTTANTGEEGGLLSPFLHDNPYRNTLTTKEGHDNWSERQFDEIRWSANWSNWDSNGNTIGEVGLFWNEWMAARMWWNNNGALDEIDVTVDGFTGAAAGDRFWRVVNMSQAASDAADRQLRTYVQDHNMPAVEQLGYEFNREEQKIYFRGTLMPEMDDGIIVAHVEPRYDHVGDWTTQQDFNKPIADGVTDELPSLAARATFDEPFEKTPDQLMTVVWLLYFRRADEFT